MKKLKNNLTITIVNDSNYESGKGSNGGAYSFSTIYQQTDLNSFIRWYETSGEFKFNPYSGQFDNCFDSNEVWDWIDENVISYTIVDKAISEAYAEGWDVVIEYE